VIGVIGVLIALLLPALRVARESAQRVKCAAQLRNLGYAFQMYANSNKGSLPAWSGWHTWPPNQPDDTEGPAWTIEMIPYMGDPDSPAYNCPAFPTRMRNYFIASIWSFVNGRRSMKLSDIKLSSQFILSGDVTEIGAYPAPYGTSKYTAADADFSDEARALLAFPEDGGFLMHRGGDNVLFADAHVDTFAAFDPQFMSFHPLKPQTWQQVHDGGPDDAVGTSPTP
jgi:type II secretory pathway pseudopilin PulG